MPWEEDPQVRSLLAKLQLLCELKPCHDCGVEPFQMHKDGCDVERCSVCGGQRLSCSCKGHDKAFARWTGIWPGVAEQLVQGKVVHMPATTFRGRELPEYWCADLNNVDLRFFIKPTNSRR